jgi:hypothetical protein
MHQNSSQKERNLEHKHEKFQANISFPVKRGFLATSSSLFLMLEHAHT